MEMADRFNVPVISFVDTAGAYPGIEAEERGQAEAIARSTESCLALGSPNVALIIGEGGSGGAIAVADVGRGHLDLADQAEGVDQQVALAAVDLLGAVVAVSPPRSVVLTLWLSRMAALGVGRRPWRTRSWACSTRWICSHNPCCRQERK